MGKQGRQFVSQRDVIIRKRTTDNLSVYTVELVASLISLEWVRMCGHQSFVVASDSMAAPTTIKSGKSSRPDILNKIYNVLYDIENEEIRVSCVGPGACGGGGE